MDRKETLLYEKNIKVARASKLQSIDVSNFLLDETLVSLHEKKMQ
jgi:hypothetical protein